MKEDSEWRNEATEINPFHTHFMKLNEMKSEIGWLTGRNERVPAEITFIKSFNSRKQSEFNEMNGLKRLC